MKSNIIKVIVVEDEVLLRKDIIFSTPWSQIGCEVIGQASDGIEAESLIEAMSPDIVITDIRMPGMDGIELLKKFSDKKDMNFIIISGFSEFSYAQEAIKNGAKNYILKPIDEEELVTTLKEVVEEINTTRKMNVINEKADYLINSNALVFRDLFEKTENHQLDDYIISAIKYIDNNYMKPINIKEVAEHLNLSEGYISRLFKEETNSTILEYITYYRMKKAVEMIKSEDVKIYEAAERVGYKDYRYFGMIFKRMVGVSPTEFKNLTRKG